MLHDRRVDQIVDVGGSAADLDARRDERLAQGADEVQRRIDDGDVAADVLRAERNRAARLEDRAAGAAPRFQRERTLRRRRPHRASQGQPAAGRLDAGQGRLVYRCTGRDHEAGGVLIELQRPDAGREAPVEIVPGPAGPEQHVGQPVVVADHAAGDHGNPARLQLTRPARGTVLWLCRPSRRGSGRRCRRRRDRRRARRRRPAPTAKARWRT